MEGNISKDTCKICREGLISKLETNEKAIQSVDEVATKRADAHAVDIKQLTRTSMELAGVQKQLAATQELLIKNLEAQEARIRELEKRLLPDAAGKKKWYDTDIGKFGIKAAIAAFFLILIVALGKGALDAFAETIKLMSLK